MSGLTCVCGAQTSGKTLVILGMLKLAQRGGLSVGAYKPVDVGELEYLSTDEASDAELFQQVGELSEHISLINPYLLHERLPPFLAAQRDGVRIDLQLLETRLEMLQKRYLHVLIEGPSGLQIPLTASENWLGLLSQWRPEVIWISDIGENALESTLFSVQALQAAGLSVKILLNNLEHQRNVELIQYHWLVLEEKLFITVLGLIPYISSGVKEEMIANVLSEFFTESWLGRGIS